MNRLAAKFKPGAGDWPGCTSLRSKETSHARSSGTPSWWNRSRKLSRQAVNAEMHGPRGWHEKGLACQGVGPWRTREAFWRPRSCQ